MQWPPAPSGSQYSVTLKGRDAEPPATTGVASARSGDDIITAR